MAILNKIRQRGLFLIIVIALALFSFVLADLFRNSDALTSKGQNIVATINGKDISRQDFMEKVELAQRSMGANASSVQAMNRVWEQEARKAVMDTEFEKLGLSVQTEEMRDLLRTRFASSPEFQNEAGLFDENKLNEFIINLQDIAPQSALLSGSPVDFNGWVNFENQLAANAMQENYFNMVRAGIGATVAEGELEHVMESELVDIKFIQIPFTSIVDSTIQVSKSDISKYIDDNKSQYEVEESRDIAYVQFKEEASLEDEEAMKTRLSGMLDDKVEYNKVTQADENVIGFKNVTTESVESYVNSNSALKYENAYKFKSDLVATSADSIFNLNLGQIYGPYKEGGYIKLSKVVAVRQLPDSAKIRHILIPYGGSFGGDASQMKTEAQAKAIADSLLGVVTRNRSKFPEIVTEFSADKQSVEKGGVIDWFAYRGMGAELRDFSFEGKKGDMGVVRAPYGFHIVEIQDQKNPGRAVKVATLAEKIEPSQKTVDNTFNETSKFEIAVSKGKFEDIAKESNYNLRPVNTIKELDENIPGVGNQRAIVRWAFEAGSKVGDVKRFNFNGGYAVVQLRAKNEAGVMTTENASVTAIPAIRKEKKAEMIKSRISGRSFEDILASENQTAKTALAINMKNPTISGAGRELKVVGAAFGLKEGETSKPITGVNGVYIVQVTKKTPAITLDNYQAKISQLTSQRTNALTTKLYNALKDASDIEDNRAIVY